ncbi:hypothetical protein ACIA74_44110 [Streptomyces sp. NPDC051658]|uniref:HNH endonuclease n=1 Tax=Streptomyces sp. NPDC051658 TaxID=3365667 RepID=UPI00378940ED
MPSRCLPAEDLRRAGRRADPAVCPPHPVPAWDLRDDRSRPGRTARIPVGTLPVDPDRSEHPAQARSQPARAGRRPDAARAGCRRFRPTQGAHLRDDLDRCRDRPPSRCSPRPHRGQSCGRTDEVEVHHVAKLADLGRPGDRPPWADLMAARHRKTLVVCGSCHADIHGKKPVPARTE